MSCTYTWRLPGGTSLRRVEDFLEDRFRLHLESIISFQIQSCFANFLVFQGVVYHSHDSLIRLNDVSVKIPVLVIVTLDMILTVKVNGWRTGAVGVINDGSCIDTANCSIDCSVI